MNKSIYERTDLEGEGLCLIPGNKDCAPLDKMLQLAKDPHVGVVPSGPHAGMHVVLVQTSFSPLESFPYDYPASRRDNPAGLRMTVQEIADIVSNKIPSAVYLRGGDPMFKWDDEIRFLVEELLERDKSIIVETSGVIFPNMYQEVLDGKWGWIGPYIILKPQIFNAVPSLEMGGYWQYLPAMLTKWKQVTDSKHWHFDIDMSADVMHQLERITIFMISMFEEGFNGETIVFTPMLQGDDWDHDHYTILRNEVGKLLLNYEGANVLVQPTLE
jgi:hypothetical protein